MCNIIVFNFVDMTYVPHNNLATLRQDFGKYAVLVISFIIIFKYVIKDTALIDD